MCRLIAYLPLVPLLTQQIILVLMNVNRGTVILWPLKILTYREVRSRIARLSTVVICVGLLVAASVASARNRGIFVPLRLSCIPDQMVNVTRPGQVIIVVMWNIFILCPLLIIVLVNCIILCATWCRRQGRIKTSLIVGRITLVLIIAQLPTSIGLLIKTLHEEADLPAWYCVCMDLTAILSCVFNPCIYRLNDMHRTRRNLAGIPIRCAGRTSHAPLSNPLMYGTPVILSISVIPQH